MKKLLVVLLVAIVVITNAQSYYGIEKSDSALSVDLFDNLQKVIELEDQIDDMVTYYAMVAETEEEKDQVAMDYHETANVSCDYGEMAAKNVKNIYYRYGLYKNDVLALNKSDIKKLVGENEVLKIKIWYIKKRLELYSIPNLGKDISNAVWLESISLSVINICLSTILEHSSNNDKPMTDKNKEKLNKSANWLIKELK